MKYVMLVISTITLFLINVVEGSTIDDANSYAKSGNYAQALTALNQVLAQEPSNARAYKIRGHVYYAKGDYAHALSDLDRAVNLSPDSANAYVDRAIVYSVMGKHGLALADVEHALHLKPSSAFAQEVRKEVVSRASSR